MKNIIATIVVSLLVGFNTGRAYEITKARKGKPQCVVKLFQARLVNMPDKHKRMEWLAVPVDDPSDTILIDFDLGELPDITSGDTIPVAGEQQPSGQWAYWYEHHWLNRRNFLLQIR